ncbi:MAG: hypothetical protein H0V76_06700 [Blastocatellia bacterium]|nr:hypothetical protein [Blastocatellia bacterium]
MLAFFTNIVFLFAAASTGDEGGFTQFWNTYLNYPGFEVWKFVNLAIFVSVLVYLLNKPLSEAFKARREEIRSELIRAEEAKKAALAKLTETEAKLASVPNEVERIKSEATSEIEVEKARLAAQAQAEAAKLRTQTEGEIVRIGQVARLELRRFAVEESIRRAEEKLRASVDESTDAQLIGSGIAAIGGMK